MAMPDTAFRLGIYHEILPLIYRNPDNANLSVRLLFLVQKLMPLDHVHYAADIDPDAEPSKIHAVYENDARGTSISLKKMQSDDRAFDEIAEYSRTHTLKMLQEKFPDAKGFHYHEIRSDGQPLVVAGFFRVRQEGGDNSFTNEEIAMIESIKEDLILMLRVGLIVESKEQRLQHFNTYSFICSRLANEYHLTETENKLVIDLLVGYSNEKIAERNFVSVSTVKTHLQHIFRKTETKNRIDFIGKFFTSPERVKL